MTTEFWCDTCLTRLSVESSERLDEDCECPARGCRGVCHRLEELLGEEVPYADEQWETDAERQAEWHRRIAVRH